MAALASLHSAGVLCQTTDAATAFADAAAAASSAPPPSDPYASTSEAYGLADQYRPTNQGGGGQARLSYTGVGTVAFAPEAIPTYGAQGFGCSFGYVSPNFTASYIGVGPSFYQQGFACGRCVKLQCDDRTCAQPGHSQIAQIVDMCGECWDADLTVATPLFRSLVGRDPNPNPSVAVSWEFVDCFPHINGTIKMLQKPGGSAYYQAFNFANSAQVIIAARVNGQLLKHESNNFWSWSPVGGPINPRGPFEFDLMGANRAVLRAHLPQLRSADLGVQFSPPPPPPEAEPAVAGAEGSP